MSTAKSSHKIDMLNGRILPKVLAFAIPLAAASILQQLFNACDTAVVGHFTGAQGMAAVGANTPVVNMLVGFATGLAVGVNVHVAGLIGRGEDKKVSAAIQTITFLGLAAGFLIAAIGILFSRPILALMDVPEDVMDEAILYLRVYSIGIPFAMLYNFGAAVLRSRGDTRRPLYILAVSGVLNVLLNLFFVLVVRMGVVGVAIATDIAGTLSCILVMRIVILEETDKRFFIPRDINGRLMFNIIKIGLPAALQGTLFSISNIVIQTSLNSFGADAIAGNTAAFNYEIIAFYICQAFSQTAVTFISQNHGAEKENRCRKVYILCMGLSIAVMTVMNVTVFLNGRFFLAFFSSEENVILSGLVRFQYVLLLQPLIDTYEITAGALRGYGYAMTPTVISITGTCVLRPVWVMTYFAVHRTLPSLLMVYPMSWVITGTVMVGAFAVLWKRGKIMRIPPK